ncbi:hypothetical protein D9758_009566 [Tetrapyrgos nigripes]|uniref:C2H2-type domain-containing protein n=1 Tax=Tetrapyrgos nigripes TaxID=182062 RepID=A0A8H5GDA3_9AGAR|nr:hypothetical protein D9758_009566 [Tetrapyrgos nigripes]
MPRVPTPKQLFCTVEGCKRAGKPFTRKADLERHHNNVHTDFKFDAHQTVAPNRRSQLPAQSEKVKSARFRDRFSSVPVRAEFWGGYRSVAAYGEYGAGLPFTAIESPNTNRVSSEPRGRIAAPNSTHASRFLQYRLRLRPGSDKRVSFWALTWCTSRFNQPLIEAFVYLQPSSNTENPIQLQDQNHHGIGRQKLQMDVTQTKVRPHAVSLAYMSS